MSKRKSDGRAAGSPLRKSSARSWSIPSWMISRTKPAANAEQHFAAGLKFARRLSQAKDFQDIARIQTEFWQSELIALNEQTKTLGKAYTKAVADAVNPRSR